jgi:hypothetical protein
MALKLSPRLQGKEETLLVAANQHNDIAGSGLAQWIHLWECQAMLANPLHLNLP